MHARRGEACPAARSSPPALKTAAKRRELRARLASRVNAPRGPRPHRRRVRACPTTGGGRSRGRLRVGPRAGLPPEWQAARACRCRLAHRRPLSATSCRRPLAHQSRWRTRRSTRRLRSKRRVRGSSVSRVARRARRERGAGFVDAFRCGARSSQVAAAERQALRREAQVRLCGAGEGGHAGGGAKRAPRASTRATPHARRPAARVAAWRARRGSAGASCAAHLLAPPAAVTAARSTPAAAQP